MDEPHSEPLIRTPRDVVELNPHPTPPYPQHAKLLLVTLTHVHATQPNPHPEPDDAHRTVHLHVVPAIGRGRVYDGDFVPQLSASEAGGDRRLVVGR